MKKIFLFIATIFYCTLSYSVPVDPTPFEYTQPDGSKLTLQGHGDEYYTWTEAGGHILIKNDKGFYEYATIADNEIVASGVLFNPRANAKVRAANHIASREEIMELIAAKRQALIAELDSIAHAEDEMIEEEQIVARKAAGPARAAKPKQSLTLGKQRVLCIMIDFSDRQFKKTPADFKNLWDGTGGIDGNKGSVREFYEENSYGNMSVEAEVFGPYRAKNPSSYYKGGIGSKPAQDLVQEALEAFKKDKNAKKFKDFDVNDDHYVDAVHIIYAGYALEAAPSVGLIHSHASNLKTSVMQGAFPIYYAKRYMITSELAETSGTKIAPMGTVCHEYGHILGAPDFYDTDDGTNGQFQGTAHWDCMGSGNWNDKGRCPAHHNPYTKAYIYNWVKPMVISPSVKNKMYTVYPSGTTSWFYRININETGEFFLLENKAKVDNNYNRGIAYYPDFGEGSLLIYHVYNENMSDYISTNTVNNSFPQKCYIVNAGAKREPIFNDPTSYGTPSDEYKWGYPSNNNRFFTATSTPSATTLLAAANSHFNYSTGVDLCFIQSDDYCNINFVVNPQIEGSEILSGSEVYSIPGLRGIPNASVQWTYTFQRNFNPPTEIIEIEEPIKVIFDGMNGSIQIERGRYLLPSGKVTPTFTTKISGDKEWNARDLTGIITGRELYYTGTATLKATIRCGGYTYVLTKDITLADPKFNAPSRSSVASSEEIELEETESQDIPEENVSYRLVYRNPVTSTAEIRVEKFENGVYVPFEGEYTLSLWGDRVGMIQQKAKSQSTCSIECGDLPLGVYQLVLQVNGKVVASSKMLKLL